jgi:hypothetical protein
VVATAVVGEDLHVVGVPSVAKVYEAVDANCKGMSKRDLMGSGSQVKRWEACASKGQEKEIKKEQTTAECD